MGCGEWEVGCAGALHKSTFLVARFALKTFWRKQILILTCASYKNKLKIKLTKKTVAA